MSKPIEITGITPAGHTVVYRISRGVRVTHQHATTCRCTVPDLRPARIRRRRRPTAPRGE